MFVSMADRSPSDANLASSDYVCQWRILHCIVGEVLHLCKTVGSRPVVGSTVGLLEQSVVNQRYAL